MENAQDFNSLGDVFAAITRATMTDYINKCVKYNIDPNARLMQTVDEVVKEHETAYEGSYKKINMLVDLLREFQTKQFDIMMGVSSLKGFGKTTLSYQVLNKYRLKYHGKPFDFEENNAYDNRDVFEKTKSLKPYDVLNCDEAVDFAMGEDWNKPESKQLKRVFTKIRTKHLIVTMAIPDFWWTDSKYREQLITLRCHLIIRGYAVLYTPDLRDGITDRWHRKELIETVKPYSYFTSLKNILPSYINHPCYRDSFAVPKMPIDIERRYLKIRDRHIFGGHVTKLDYTDIIAGVFYRLHKLSPNFTYRKLEELAMNPLNNQKTVGYVTIKHWVDRIQQKLDQQTPVTTPQDSQ